MISGLTDADSLPVLERMMQFSAGRQRLLADAVANFSTPGHRPRDVSVEDFQATLGAAVDERRERHSARGGALPLASTGEVRVESDRLELAPDEANENLLFHDENDRDLDRAMQALAENVMTMRTMTTLHRSRMDLLNSALRERP